MKFYLGTHKISQKWWDQEIPLFVSRRTLIEKKKPPRATTGWALDSGGFTELKLHGRWTITAREYVENVRHFHSEIGHLEWVAPMDWMCEPMILAKTGLSVGEHQSRTTENFLELRDRLGPLVIPVLQGWERDDYLRHWQLYEDVWVDLETEPVVGLGTVCRRQDTSEAGIIVRSLQPLRLHGFGIKITGLESFGDVLHSADSMAWSYRARHDRPLRGCTHQRCTNCIRYALRWRGDVLSRQDQLRLEVA